MENVKLEYMLKNSTMETLEGQANEAFQEGDNYIDSEPEVIVKKAVVDLMVRHHQRKSRKDTLVYRLIRGGNAEVVKKILHHLKTRKLKIEINWLLGIRTSPPKVHRKSRLWRDILDCLYRPIVMFILTIFMIVTTPLFYIIHEILRIISDTRRKRISQDIDLPLAFAIVSENEQMVNIFSEHGVTLSSVDSRGNNIFHYLADLSSDNYPKAAACFELIKRMYNVRFIKAVLMEQENEDGLNALEATVKFGSLKLLHQITQTEDVMQRTVISVGKNNIWMRSQEIADEELRRMSVAGEQVVCKMGKAVEGGYRICRFDVSSYEQGDILLRQSLPLHLLCNKDFETMEEDEIQGFTLTKGMTSWCAIKVASTKVFCILTRLYSAFVYFLFVMFLLLDSSDVDPHPLSTTFFNAYYDAVIYAVEQETNMTVDPSSEFAQKIYRTFNVVPDASDFNMTSEIISLYCTGNSSIKPLDVELNACARYAFESTAKACHGLSTEELAIGIGIIPNMAPMLMQMILLICVLATFELVVDFIFKMTFVIQHFKYFDESFLKGMKILISNKLPAPYVEKNLSVTSCCFFLVYMALRSNMMKMSSNIKAMQIIEDVMSATVIMSLLIQSMYLVYILRLVPIVGLFIRTTAKLMRNLLEFMIAYGMVAVCFSLVFHFLLRDEVCPAKKMEGYTDVVQTFYNIYLAMLGQGDFPVDYNEPVKMAYFIYSLISVVMLLNLIIAVMSTTANRLMNSPWREVLETSEHLSVALYNEAMRHILLWPFRKCFKKFCSKERKEFVTFKVNDRLKVYVEVEYDT